MNKISFLVIAFLSCFLCITPSHAVVSSTIAIEAQESDNETTSGNKMRATTISTAPAPAEQWQEWVRKYPDSVDYDGMPVKMLYEAKALEDFDEEIASFKKIKSIYPKSNIIPCIEYRIISGLLTRGGNRCNIWGLVAQA